MGPFPSPNQNDPHVQHWIQNRAEQQTKAVAFKYKLQPADREELISMKMLEALLQLPKHDPERGPWEEFIYSKMSRIGLDWIRGPVELPAKVAQHVRKMRVLFGDDVDAAWAATEPLALKGIRQFEPFFNAFMIASSTVSINPQGDLVGEVSPDKASPIGITPVSLVAPDVSVNNSDLIAEHVNRWYAGLSERDKEIWTLYKSSYYQLRGVRGIELALSRKPGTDLPLASKSTIARRIKAMEEDLRSVLDVLLFAA
jgi:hypothetical protein